MQLMWEPLHPMSPYIHVVIYSYGRGRNTSLLMRRRGLLYFVCVSVCLSVCPSVSTEQTHNSDMAYENDLCSSSSDGSHLPATLTTSRQSALVSLSQPSHVCATTSEDIITE